MSFNWNEYYDLAKQLAQEPGEAQRRSAISRAYYAAYWKARELLELSDGRLPRNVHPHEYVWNAFYSDACSAGGTIGEAGNFLRKKRADADYEGGKYISVGDVEVALKRASAIIGDVAKLTP